MANDDTMRPMNAASAKFRAQCAPFLCPGCRARWSVKTVLDRGVVALRALVEAHLLDSTRASAAEVAALRRQVQWRDAVLTWVASFAGRQIKAKDAKSKARAELQARGVAGAEAGAGGVSMASLTSDKQNATAGGAKASTASVAVAAKIASVADDEKSAAAVTSTALKGPTAKQSQTQVVKSATVTTEVDDQAAVAAAARAAAGAVHASA